MAKCNSCSHWQALSFSLRLDSSFHGILPNKHTHSRGSQSDTMKKWSYRQRVHILKLFFYSLMIHDKLMNSEYVHSNKHQLEIVGLWPEDACDQSPDGYFPSSWSLGRGNDDLIRMWLSQTLWSECLWLISDPTAGHVMQSHILNVPLMK